MLSQQYEITVKNLNGVASLDVAGELDLAEADRFHDELCRYGSEATEGLELDLRELRFIDSSGMQALVNARHQLVASGRTFRIVAASPIAQRVFTLAGLDELFGCTTD